MLDPASQTQLKTSILLSISSTGAAGEAGGARDAKSNLNSTDAKLAPHKFASLKRAIAGLIHLSEHHKDHPGALKIGSSLSREAFLPIYIARRRYMFCKIKVYSYFINFIQKSSIKTVKIIFCFRFS